MAQKLTTLTLVFCIVLVISFVQASNHALGGVGRREHNNLKRFIRKRAPQFGDDFPFGGPVAGAGDGPPTLTGSSTASASQSSSSSSSASSSSSGSQSSSASESSSSSSPSSSSSSSSSSSETTSSAVTSEALPTSEAFTAIGLTQDANSTPSKSTLTRTATAATASETEIAAPSGLTSKGKTAILTVLIVVAASVAGVAILWTIFRKWKLGRSKEFDERLRPIDWQPTHDDDGPVPGHRRANSNASSFHSGHGHGSAGRGYGATSDLDSGHETRLGALPDHDFTAGPNHLAAIGGYADLARGPSPSPQPQMAEPLGRGPSLTSPNYGNGLPLHHQTGYDSHDYNARY